MTVFAPGDDPPPNAVDPGMWARLMGYAGALSPIGSAQADTLTRANPLNHPSPVPAALQGGGPPVPPAMLGGGQPPAPTNPLTQPSPVDPRLVGGGPPVDADTLARIRASIVGNGGSSGGGGASNHMPWPNQVTDPLTRNMPVPPVGDPTNPANRNMPWPNQVNPTGAPPQVGQQQQAPPSAPLPPVRPAATIDPRMRGEVPPAQSPWITSAYDRPNMNPGTGGGMLGGALAGPRGAGGPPQMGMLDLSGIFRGGQPAAPAAAQPRTKIDVGKIPANARAEVPPDAASKAPSDYGPLQKGRNWKLKNNNPDLYR